ncbi:hypothetical protein BCIN_11g02800 [Botrytis cinerea B05.10]|uniref:Uncharacterized protein n=3 Tax=Botryotinia fuckeliana TaxID=40559 RepID=A0A384JWR1_BOTFB|nr:hypothetical protein BCIN_11g02800 [Botrytis cinerea B05.10]ATZ54968.1 hypothetical protein BCIN_11g02800 [Botrytis cinerea B05.10]EMR81697.1 hypothetical protein BcDW1_9615 [Botrytis cinerea BcDW1]CCD47813.1 hypothetical protein BofuT4_P037930.1 [Botrytis cinerea T4]
MNRLPPEILDSILQKNIEMSRDHKAQLLGLRLVCKAFDQGLKSSIFKTTSLEFSRFARFKNIDDNPDQLKTLRDVVSLSSCVYIDMMITRDTDEIDQLKETFNAIYDAVPEMADLIDSLRSYCLNETTFTEEDYSGLVCRIMQGGPDISRLKINLPFQVVSNAFMTSTRLFANTLACAANRPEEHRKIDTLVLDHITDVTINSLCNVHIDVENAFKVFQNLKSLVISFKRQESRTSLQTVFARNFWLLIGKAQDLETLCLIGWNVAQTTKRIRNRRVASRMTNEQWTMRCLPYYPSKRLVLSKLKCLELKRMDLDPLMLLLLIKETRHSLIELYLNDIGLKVNGSTDRENTSLWIGYQNIQKPDECTWVAPAIRDIEGLNLKVLRVSKLGYDDYSPDLDSETPNYDLDDPTGHNQSFDQRFVEAVMGTKATLPLELAFDTSSDMEIPHGNVTDAEVDPSTYDAEAYQKIYNSTSNYKKSIDGIFCNNNERALRELQNIVSVADRGMALLTREVERGTGLTADPISGAIVDPPVGT